MAVEIKLGNEVPHRILPTMLVGTRKTAPLKSTLDENKKGGIVLDFSRKLDDAELIQFPPVKIIVDILGKMYYIV